MTHITIDMKPEGSYDSNVYKNQKDDPMSCDRCKGLLTREFCFDLQDETGQNGFWGLRCMHCGDIIDPVIARNRHADHPVLLKNRSRRK